ncbi:N-acetyltransferase [Ahniella affigens]|uniref:N-acetyltransferase n=1 Tax=Ahniella affigens TaxID=2021234 RepID=A0A2P1PQI7_9GAMM|nr:GNAT family N-acetyltransferase [Ahniella affigens]AVP97105.1 N-acetyltransferase [Ahniella affigens]
MDSHPNRPATIRQTPKRHYLGRWREQLRWADGLELLIRPIEVIDAGPLREGFSKLEPEEVRLRFLHPMTELTEAYARELCDLDPALAFALVATEPGEPGSAAIGGVARLAFDLAKKRAEFAIIVGHQIGGRGIGRLMMQRLIECARKRGMHAIFGDVLIENLPMTRLAHALGFRTQSIGEPGLIRVWKDLRVTTATELGSGSGLAA